MAFQIPRDPLAFSLDKSRKGQGGRLRDDRHLKFIRRLPCLVSGRTGQIDAAHIRYGDPKFDKPGTPMARKPDDKWTVPLNHMIHLYDQHQNNERQWWIDKGIDVLQVATDLYRVSGDLDAGFRIVHDARRNIPPWRT